ncbi:MAG: hypothetical protein CR982_07425 [Candidatus Cloacimonadota bacterium]|nr:MAG: hypothetical protein CR982_07425 [Candidatus Cloacimonadota bacterium]PIE80163.1 MAG: hypothetical protein CSA15_02070 [Candidatus Delongbacteria bacterium]
MNRIALITIGDEILNGSTQDKHLNYIGKSLYNNGIKVSTHVTISDDNKTIIETIKYLLKSHNIIITTGGLGPTPDDKTVDTVANLFNRKCVISEVVLNDIKGFFKRVNREVNPLSRDQAYIIEGANFYRNKFGTAPGHYIRFNDSFNINDKGNNHLFLLPGVPYEMRYLFDTHVKRCVIDLFNEFIITRNVYTYGIGESDLVLKISNLEKISKEVELGFYPQSGGVKISLTARGNNKTDIEKRLEKSLELLSEDIDTNIVEGGSASKRLVEKLKKKDYKISFGESCTGGLLSSSIVSIPGASKVFDRSFVTYSNKSKFEVLNVSPYTLEINGAVSKETVDEMLEGLLAETKSDIVAAVSGIAGPEGGSKEKPVGTVYIGIEERGKKRVVERRFFNGDREEIQKRTVSYLFNEITNLLQ